MTTPSKTSVALNAKSISRMRDKQLRSRNAMTVRFFKFFFKVNMLLNALLDVFFALTHGELFC